MKENLWNDHSIWYFTFPPNLSDELLKEIKKRAKENMAIMFKSFKWTLYEKYILEGKEPDFKKGEYKKQKAFWEAFKAYRLSLEYKKVSDMNKENSCKATNPHRLGSRGYVGQFDKFDAEITNLQKSGTIMDRLVALSRKSDGLVIIRVAQWKRGG